MHSDTQQLIIEIEEVLGQWGGEILMDETIKAINKAITVLSWYLNSYEDLKRLNTLAQENQDYFGNPPAGTGILKLVADRLEKDISVYRKRRGHRFTRARMEKIMAEERGLQNDKAT